MDSLELESLCVAMGLRVMGLGFGLWLVLLLIALSIIACLVASCTDYFAETLISCIVLVLFTFFILLLLQGIGTKPSLEEIDLGPEDWATVGRITMVCFMALGFLAAIFAIFKLASHGVFTKPRDERSTSSLLIPPSHRIFLD